jgi:cation transport protein ChaC
MDEPSSEPSALSPHSAAALKRLREQWTGDAERWVFGYASLIWRPEFEAAEHRPATVRGWHRAFRMRSRVYRGTEEQPGIVCALLPGGSCRGVAYRLRPDSADIEIEKLWAREMFSLVYDARLLVAHTAQGPVRALAFTLARRSEHCWPALAEAELLHILRHARGRYGTTLEYLTQTANALRERGCGDRQLERMLALARRHGLVG